MLLQYFFIWLALQWVPNHVGILGNERANQKAKQGAQSSQPEVTLILRRVKALYFDKYTVRTQKTKSLVKSWETLTTVGPIPKQPRLLPVFA
ncbi:hypothetical protein TNCV_3391911 [Trichonephila clavipes]|nr:hypothetical protein TNCV_3391911 [Trichonephila clavipes]